ncbi:MAG: DUF2892 domain-containing protein [Pseudomonadota bacterium]
MKTNVGIADMIVRIFVGVVLIGMAITGVIGWWGYIGIIPILTGIVRFCPAYAILGLNTKDKHKGDNWY